MNITQEMLETMKNTDAKSVDFDSLKDIRDVKIDTSLPKERIHGNSEIHSMPTKLKSPKNSSPPKFTKIIN